MAIIVHFNPFKDLNYFIVEENITKCFQYNVIRDKILTHALLQDYIGMLSQRVANYPQFYVQCGIASLTEVKCVPMMHFKCLLQMVSLIIEKVLNRFHQPLVSFIQGRCYLRPPLDDKKFPVHRVGKKKGQSGGRFFFFPIFQ